MSNLKHISDNEIMLCCGGKACPVVSQDGDSITIMDDDGGSVKLTVEQARAIPEALDNFSAEEE